MGSGLCRSSALPPLSEREYTCIITQAYAEAMLLVVTCALTGHDRAAHSLKTHHVVAQRSLEQVNAGTPPSFRHRTSLSILKQKKSNTPYPPWENWDLDDEFLKTLSEYCLEHPETTLSRVLDNICCHLETGKDLFEVIPDQPFPARSLFKALACLVRLGVVSALIIASHSRFHLCDLDGEQGESKRLRICEGSGILGQRCQIGLRIDTEGRLHMDSMAKSQEDAVCG